MSPSYFSYDRHPAAELFPMMNDDELEKLAADIRANGLREPVVLFEGQILDGRNRLRACELAETEPRFEQWDEDGSPVAFVLSRNLHRRHLDESQRAVVASRARELFKDEAAERQRSGQFGKRKTHPSEVVDEQKPRISTVGVNLHRPERSNVKVARMFNVSEKSVAFANRVLAAGDEQVIAAVTEGAVSVSDAAAIVKLAKPRQRDLLALVHSGKARTLRAAAKMKKPKTLPPAVLRSDPPEPQVLRAMVRRAYKCFMADIEEFRGYVNMAAAGCGGDNDFTRRARECLAGAQVAMSDCAEQYGRAKRA